MAKKKREGIPAVLEHYMSLDNIAPELNEQILTNMAFEVITKADKDDESRSEWKKRYKKSMEIAKQISTGKNTPWRGAADVKFPLLLSAAIQYNARMFPEIVQGSDVVKTVDMNEDPTDEELDRADLIANHMSWQCIEQISNWISDTDKLFMVLPLVGTIYRKSQFDSIEKQPAVDLCLPDDIIVHNDVASLEKAERITHILHLSNNELLEYMRAGIFNEYPLEELEEGSTEDNTISNSSSPTDNKTNPELHKIYEQHTWWDLDDDGYKEPYIITVHCSSAKVLRIVARYTKDSFIFTKRSKMFVKIKADKSLPSFTDFHFMPSPDGRFHSMGFGQYLYPLNETVNTIINQLLDAGTLQNRGGGFIAKALRMAKQSLTFEIGEFKTVNVPSGSTLTQNILPMPTPGPSPVLLQLLDLLIKSAQELASISDIMQGQSPGPNTPATTVMSVIEQGSKVYSSMLNRIYNSFKNEFENLFQINKRYLDVEESFARMGQSHQVTLEDYKSANLKVFPVADPNISSDAHRMAKIQALMQYAMEDPEVNKHEVMKRFLEAFKIPQPEKILPEPDPNAPPPIAELQAQAELLHTQADTRHLHMKSNEIIMKHDREAIKSALGAEAQQIDAAYKGGIVTANKVDAIAKLAQTDAVIGEKQVNNAAKQAEMMQTIIQTPVAGPIEQETIKPPQEQAGEAPESPQAGTVPELPLSASEGAPPAPEAGAQPQIPPETATQIGAQQ